MSMFSERLDMQTPPVSEKFHSESGNSSAAMQFWRDFKENDPNIQKSEQSDKCSVKSDNIPEKTELDAKNDEKIEKQETIVAKENDTLQADEEFKNKLSFKSEGNKFSEFREQQIQNQRTNPETPRKGLYAPDDNNNNIFNERDFTYPKDNDYYGNNVSADTYGRRQHYDYGNNNRYVRHSNQAYPPIQPSFNDEQPKMNKRTSAQFSSFDDYRRPERNPHYSHRSEQLSFSEMLSQQVSQNPLSNSNHCDRKTLYVGNLHQIVNEHELTELFKLFGKVVSCKIHKEHHHKSYCFIEFEEAESADAARIAMNQRIIHKIPIEVNWANTNSTLYSKKKLPQDKFGVFVGDLPANLSNDTLYKMFHQNFHNVVDARIVVEPQSQKSKQYGFVNFTVKHSAEHAINEWNGRKEVDGRPIRLGWADRAQRNIPTKSYEEVRKLNNYTTTNSTVYIGGVKDGVCEEKLKDIFKEFGEMKELRLFTDKGYAFVSYVNHQSAEEAIRYKTGTQIEGHTIRCAWGRETNGPPENNIPPGFLDERRSMANRNSHASGANSDYRDTFQNESQIDVSSIFNNEFEEKDVYTEWSRSQNDDFGGIWKK